MPLFGNKFTPKKIPRRKKITTKDIDKICEEIGNENGIITLKLENQEIMFECGKWTVDSGALGFTNKENQKLHKQIQKLEEEKNLLLIKFEVLFNLCTQITAESYFKDNEIETLKNELENLEK